MLSAVSVFSIHFAEALLLLRVNYKHLCYWYLTIFAANDSMTRKPTDVKKSEGTDLPRKLSYWERPGVRKPAKLKPGERAKEIRRLEARAQRLTSLASKERFDRDLATKTWNELLGKVFWPEHMLVQRRLFGNETEQLEALRALNPELYEKLQRSGKNKKIEEIPPSEVPLEGTPASEGFIRDDLDQPQSKEGVDSSQFTELPDTPPKLWQGGRPGRPKPGEANALVMFLREVYGPYFLRFRDQLRDYIFRNDRKLYTAITNFERHSQLPEDVALPTRSERVLSRLQHAAAQGGFEGMSESEKRSVMGRLKRGNNSGPS